MNNDLTRTDSSSSKKWSSAIGYGKIRKNLTDFDALLASIGVRIGNDSPVKPYLDLTREFLADEQGMPAEQWLAKWDPRFKEFYQGQILVDRLTESLLVLKDQRQGALKDYLKKVLSGSLVQDFEPQQAKDFLYELELAATLKQAGFGVELREPDIVLTGNGLSGPLAIACKYPSSVGQIHTHLSKSYSQIAKQKLDGLVALGMDQLVFGGMSNYMDFRQGERHPMEVLQDALGQIVRNLVVERARDYPSEKPLDGAIFTLTAGGIFGEPACLTFMRALTLQCDAENPRIKDIGVVVRGLDSLSRPVSVGPALPAGT